MIFCKLSEIKQGTKAIIRSIEQDDISLKMLEMGIIPGEIVYVDLNKGKKSGIVINIGASTLSLRRDEAEKIIVETNI